MVPESLWGLGVGVCAGLRVFTAPEEVSLQPQGAELEKHSWAGEEDLPILELLENVSEGPCDVDGMAGPNSAVPKYRTCDTATSHRLQLQLNHKTLFQN